MTKAGLKSEGGKKERNKMDGKTRRTEKSKKERMKETRGRKEKRNKRTYLD